MTVIPVLPGATSQSITFKVLDNTTGLIVTTLTSATAGLVISYSRTPTGAVTAIPLSDLAAADSVWSSGGLKHKAGGEYRLCIPNDSVPATEGDVTMFAGVSTAYQILGCKLVGKPAELTSAQAQTAGSAALTAYDPPTHAELTAGLAAADDATLAAIAALSIPTASANADATWDELLAGHVIAGSAGALLATAGAAADPMLNTPGDYSSGTLGYYIGRLAGGRITVQATTTPTGEIPEIVAGADYLAEDGRAFEWTDAEEVWPDLTGATITFCARTPGGVTVEHAGTVVTPTGEKVVRAELTHVQTAYLATIRTGGWNWCVWAELADGNLIPLIRGATPVLVVVGPPEP